MKGGWLEHEIRSLPHVLACSINADDVVVLVQSSADPASVESAVRDVLHRTGTDVPVRVFGGVRPLFIEPIRVRTGRSAFVGSLGGAAILAAGVWLAGATTGLRGTPKSKVPVTLLAPPRPLEVYTLPVVGGDGGSTPLIPQEVTAPDPLLRPLRLARIGTEDPETHHTVHHPPIRPPASQPPPMSQPPPVPPPTDHGRHHHKHEHRDWHEPGEGQGHGEREHHSHGDSG